MESVLKIYINLKQFRNVQQIQIPRIFERLALRNHFIKTIFKQNFEESQVMYCSLQKKSNISQILYLLFKMENKYVANYDKFKWVIPGSYITVFFIAIFGPSLFPILFVYICSYFGIAAAILRMCYLMMNSAIGLYRSLKLPYLGNNPPKMDLSHIWVIPSYNQDQKVLSSTLNFLGKHSRAKQQYTVMLAMEAHEPNSQLKAQNLIKNHKHLFHEMNYTCHVIVEGQAKGKATNVSYCVQKLEQMYPNKYDFHNKVFLSIIDCDSWVPVEYMDHVQNYIMKNPEKSFKCVFNPSQIFKRNDMNVPVVTRTFDNYHAFAHWTTAVSFLEVASPWGNYTLSYRVIKEVGFWDKCNNSIAQDIHNFSKIFWRRKCDAYVVPILTPFNSLNLDCGNNYIQNCKGKFWQAVRHGQAIYECSYNIHQFSIQKTFSFRSFGFLFYFIETVLFHTTFSTYLLLYLAARSVFISYETNPIFIQLYPRINFILHFANIGNIICLVLFQIYRRWAHKRFYGCKKPQSWWRALEYVVFLTVGLNVYFSGSFLVATIKTFFKQMKYVVAAKIHRQQKQE